MSYQKVDRLRTARAEHLQHHLRHRWSLRESRRLLKDPIPHHVTMCPLSVPLHPRFYHRELRRFFHRSWERRGASLQRRSRHHSPLHSRPWQRCSKRPRRFHHSRAQQPHNGAATCPHSVQVFFHKCAHSAWLSCARACIRVSSCAGADSPATNGGPLGAASYSSAGGVAAAGSTAGGVAAGDCCQTRARATQTSAAAATAEAAAAPEAVAEGPAAVPARTVALPQVDTSLPSTQVSTASAAMPSSGRAPVPCQPSSSALKPSEIPLPDDASSDTEETPAPRQKTEVAARRRQPVRRLFQSRPWTLPEFNNAEPVKRYQWKVLPQGVKNSPTVCQCLQARSTCPERKSGYGIYSQVGRPM
ncbi:angiomotin-like [Corvus cornix cornix]|uniref:angiomotin-like n=1 Tax=Corvus cornix cornix TaxID=932674 RepID=UPI0019510D88|nr:angiomotin-like [Corvus cornix cornix]